MIVRRATWRHPTTQGWRFVLVTHQCCGLRWEVLLSNRFPARGRAPVCPRCGGGDTSPPYSRTADLASRPSARSA
jgi:hypothetical protein